MEQRERMTRGRPKSKSISTPPPLSEGSQSVPSPELLQTVQVLQEEIADLKSKQGMTAAEKEELRQLRADMAEARAEAKALKTETEINSPVSRQSKRVVHFGTFAIQEDVG